ncbi:MAG: hypothetical protein ABL921_32505 [Pirellula sp.]
MLHRNRTWSLQAIDGAERLACKLSHVTWTCCQAFELKGYIFANDATSADGAQEYAILRATRDCPELIQIESITFSWCTEQGAFELIKAVCAGDFDGDGFCHVARDRFQTMSEHISCGHCA